MCTTIFHALEAAGWDRKTGTVVIQRTRNGKRHSRLFTVDTPELDIPLGYDYAKKEDVSVIAKDATHIYLHWKSDEGDCFIPVPLDLAGAYCEGAKAPYPHSGEVVPVIGDFHEGY